MNMFTSDEIIEAYEKNDIQIGKDYIRVGDKTERYEDLHLGAVNHIGRILNNEYEGETPDKELLSDNVFIQDIKLEKNPNIEKPYRVIINNSTWGKDFRTVEESKRYYNHVHKNMKKQAIRKRMGVPRKRFRRRGWKR